MVLAWVGAVFCVAHELSIQMIKARFDRTLGDFRLALDVTIPSRGVTIIFGASGSGKTTFLRCMAGLEPEALGSLVVGDQVWQDDDRGVYLPCHRRPIGYVFQDAALFPHLTVEKNLVFGLHRVSPEARWITMDQAIDLLGIGHLLKRDPRHLSGGEQQRIALARALLTSPQILLLDEPLAALDLPMKGEILPYLERLRLELNIPILYVTHALEELTRLGDHLVQMDQGQVTREGPIASVLSDLTHSFDPLGEWGGVLFTVIAGHDRLSGLTDLSFQGGGIKTPLIDRPVGTPVRLSVSPNDISLTLNRASETSILNIIDVLITDVTTTQDPHQVMVHLAIGETSLKARITRYSLGKLKLSPGMHVFAQIKAVSLLA